MNNQAPKKIFSLENEQQKPHELPFSVPNHYFEQLPNAVESRMNGETKSDLLTNKSLIFSIPDNYFDWLPSRIQARIADLSASRWQWYQTPTFKYALVTACLLLAFGLVWQNSTKSSAVEDTLAQISNQEAAEYIQNNTLISQNEAIELYAQSDKSLQQLDIGWQTLSKDSIMEQIDLNVLEDELID